MPASITPVVLVVLTNNRDLLHTITEEAEFSGVLTRQPELIGDILDLMTGRTQATLAAITTQTKHDLSEAQTIATGLEAIPPTK